MLVARSVLFLHAVAGVLALTSLLQVASTSILRMLVARSVLFLDAVVGVPAFTHMLQVAPTSTDVYFENVGQYFSCMQLPGTLLSQIGYKVSLVQVTAKASFQCFFPKETVLSSRVAVCENAY